MICSLNYRHLSNPLQVGLLRIGSQFANLTVKHVNLIAQALLLREVSQAAGGSSAPASFNDP